MPSNSFNLSNRPPQFEDSYFPLWSIFARAKNSRDIKDEPIIVLITITKIYLGYCLFYLKMNVEIHSAFIYSDIQILL